jgi:hypothetical protein
MVKILIRRKEISKFNLAAEQNSRRRASVRARRCGGFWFSAARKGCTPLHHCSHLRMSASICFIKAAAAACARAGGGVLGNHFGQFDLSHSLTHTDRENIPHSSARRELQPTYTLLSLLRCSLLVVKYFN